MLKVFPAVLVSLLFVPLVRADLITNGGFETGDFTGWTQSGWLIDTTNPNSGVYDASTGCSGAFCTTVGDPNSSYLYQDLATTVAAKYTLSFFYNSGQLATQGSELLVLWGDPNAPGLTTVVDFANVDTAGKYLQFTVTVTATSASSQLEFLGRQDLDFYSLDDVTLIAQTSTSGAPEPGSLLLVVAGAAGLGLKKLSSYSLRKPQYFQY